ncbi:cytoplasmic tRNA 2-thiolation protein 2, partial [Paragonimus westermani]
GIVKNRRSAYQMCSTEGSCSCSVDSAKKAIQDGRREMCVKCKGSCGPPVIVIRSDDPALCRLCFLDACLHKFKSAFGKAQVVPDGVNVAVGFSGGVSSLVLLSLLKEHTKRRFLPKVFHLSEPNTAEAELRTIEENMRNSGFEYYTFDPEQVNLTAGRLRAALHLSSSQSITTLKNLPDADKWIRHVLLTECARLMNCGFLCLGDNGTRVANNFLMGVIEGRGGHSCIETTFLDQRLRNVAIIRPLRDFMVKELVFYARFSNLNVSTPRDLVTQAVLERPARHLNSSPRITRTEASPSAACVCYVYFMETTVYDASEPGASPSLNTITDTLIRDALSKTCADLGHLNQYTLPPVDPAPFILCVKAPITRTSGIHNPNKLAMASLLFSRSVAQPKHLAADCPEDNIKRRTSFEQLLCFSCSAIYEELPKELKPTFEESFLNFESSAFATH